MTIKSFITMCVCAFCSIGVANAYKIEARFETQHYGVYQVILGKGEVKNISGFDFYINEKNGKTVINACCGLSF